MSYLYSICGETIELNIEEKYVRVNGINNKKVSFDKMDKLVQKYKGCNRIYKPYALLLYIDYKNNKLSNYKDCLLRIVR